MKRIILTSVVALLCVLPLQAQDNLNEVHLFQSYFYDAPIAKSIYGEGGLSFSSYDKLNTIGLGVQGGYPVNEKIEVQSVLRFLNWSPEKGDSKSGISDLGLFGRYNVYNQKQTNISAGAMLTLPIGSEDVGEGNFNFGAFGALRHSLQNNLVLAGTLGLFFVEGIKNDRDTNLQIGGGAIYKLNQQLNFVGELNIWSEGDYMLLSAGADYLLGSGRLKGALGLGLDDGAPDFLLSGGYSVAFSK